MCDTTACQVYAGVDGEHSLGNAAVRATARQILMYDGKPAFTEFSSSNGGWTVASDIPYQVAKRDDWDPVNPWRTTLRATAIEHVFPAIGDFQRLRVRLRDGADDLGPHDRAGGGDQDAARVQYVRPA